MSAMKGTKKVIIFMLAMLLALSLCGFAMAEDEADSSSGTPTEDVLKEAEEKNQALSDALTAYKTAKQESRKKARLASLKKELDGYVAAGSLTQEQADLLLNYYAELLAQNGNDVGRGHGGKGLNNRLQKGQNGLGRGSKRGGKSRQMPASPQSGNTTSSPEGNGV